MCCCISLLGSLLWKWSSAIRRILQSLLISTVIKQGPSEVKTSYWLFACRQWSKQDFRCTSTDTCNYLHGKNKSQYAVICPVSCLQKVLGHLSYMPLVDTEPFWLLQQDKFHLLQIPEKINMEEKYYKATTFQVVSAHIKVVFLRVALTFIAEWYF